MKTINAILDRNGQIFVAIVLYDWDAGWICAEWHDGEYEENNVDEYGHTEEGRQFALDEGLRIAKARKGRVLHCYESPETINKKRKEYQSELDY